MENVSEGFNKKSFPSFYDEWEAFHLWNINSRLCGGSYREGISGFDIYFCLLPDL